MDEQNNMNAGNGGMSGNGSSAGPIIGIIIILAIIILGGLYFWSQRSTTTDDAAMQQETMDNINSQSASDTAASIEADLNSTDVNTVDSQINAS